MVELRNENGRKLRTWEDSHISHLPCKGCDGLGIFQTADIIAACRRCGQCRECQRDRKDPCGECLAWDEENRGANGKVETKGVRDKRRKRNE